MSYEEQLTNPQSKQPKSRMSLLSAAGFHFIFELNIQVVEKLPLTFHFRYSTSCSWSRRWRICFLLKSSIQSLKLKKTRSRLRWRLSARFFQVKRKCSRRCRCSESSKILIVKECAPRRFATWKARPCCTFGIFFEFLRNLISEFEKTRVSSLFEG